MIEQTHTDILYEQLSPELQNKLQKLDAFLEGAQKPNISSESEQTIRTTDYQNKKQFYERIQLLLNQLENLHISDSGRLLQLQQLVEQNSIPLEEAWKQLIEVSQELTPQALEAQNMPSGPLHKLFSRVMAAFAHKSAQPRSRL